MENKKQTAVQWLVEKLEQNKFITKSQIYIAEKMEKEQIVEAYKAAEDKSEFFEYEHRYGREYLTAEPYYHETYGK